MPKLTKPQSTVPKPLSFLNDVAKPSFALTRALKRLYNVKAITFKNYIKQTKLSSQTTARLVAGSSAVSTKWIEFTGWHKAATITQPKWSLTTTPIPTLFVPLKRAASKLALKLTLGRGDQHTGERWAGLGNSF